MGRLLIFLLLILSFNVSASDVIRVGLFKASKINIIDIFLSSYDTQIVLNNEITISGESKGYPYRIVAEKNLISVYYNSLKLGTSKEVRVLCKGNQTVFFKPKQPDYPGNNYTGELIFKANAGLINSVNELPIDTYLNGVIRGEIGFDKDPVVYEVHSIMSRTYAFRFLDKHKGEGFNLCDQTHCQVFKGYFDYEQFDHSISLTSNIVLLEYDKVKLVEGLFHANCGGITSASEDVWSAKLDYCRPVVDTFCLLGKHANWEVIMEKPEFLNRLNLSEKEVECNDICYYNNDRSVYLSINGNRMKTVDLRKKLKLKSTFFNFECDDEVVKISGKGFGHGVGLCQEGAIRMAELCFSAEEILKFYYSGTVLGEYKLENPF